MSATRQLDDFSLTYVWIQIAEMLMGIMCTCDVIGHMEYFILCFGFALRRIILKLEPTYFFFFVIEVVCYVE